MLIIVNAVLIPAFIVWVLVRFGGEANPAGHAIAPDSADRLEALWDIPDFELIDSEGQAVSKSDLAGKIWVADFIFTRCPGPCPRMTRKMLALQRKLRPGDPVLLVSFTVDPAYDTPAVLAKYSAHYGVEQSTWRFLTGDPQTTIALIRDGFFTAVQSSSTDLDPSSIIHGTHFLLVDAKGTVRGIYDSQDEILDSLLSDIERLVAEIEEPRR